MPTKEELVGDVELRLTRGKPSDDFEVEKLQIEHWIDTVRDVRVKEIYILYGELKEEDIKNISENILVDKIIQQYQYFSQDELNSARIKDIDNLKIVEVAYNLGVMDPWEESIKKAVLDLGIKSLEDVKTAKQYLIEGDIDVTLPEFCQQFTGKIDLAFIDANHQYKPAVTYFNQLVSISHVKSTIIIDDIYWSAGMTAAWEQIKNHPQVTTTIDLYNTGIVFFRPELQKEHIYLKA